MRYAAAGILAVFGIVLGALGIAQVTIWAPSDTIEATAELSDPGSVVVVEPGVMNLYPGASTITAEGEGEVTIAQASKENVDAWVDSAAHTSITGLLSQTELRTEKVGGDAEVPDPKDSDLWETSTTSEGTAQVEWDRDAGRTELLIGTDGTSPGAQQVTITWANNATTPLAAPLMIAGALLVVIAVIVAFLSWRKGRRDAERRAKRAERRRKLAEMGTAFAVVPVIALAGCGTQELPEPQAEEAPEEAGGVITDDQLKTILSTISETVTEADSGADAKALEDRAAGPFLKQRKGAYSIRKKDDSFDLPPAVATEEVKVNFTSATDQWPRVTAAVTASEELGQTQLLVLSQESPRDPWKVWAQTVLLAGTEFPSVNDARQGSELLAADASGFVLSPEKTVSSYADVLDNGSDSKSKDSFEDDAFRKQIASDLKKAKESVKDGNASVDFTFTAAGADQLMAQRAGDSAMLVVGTVEQTVTYKPESVDGRSGRLEIPKPQSSVVGGSSTSKNLESTYTQMYAFIVPAEGDGKASLIGVTSSLTGAKLS